MNNLGCKLLTEKQRDEIWLDINRKPTNFKIENIDIIFNSMSELYNYVKKNKNIDDNLIISNSLTEWGNISALRKITTKRAKDMFD